MNNNDSVVPIPRGMSVRQEAFSNGEPRYTCNYCGHSCGWHPMFINHGNRYCDNLNLLAILAEGRDIVEDSRTIAHQMANEECKDTPQEK